MIQAKPLPGPGDWVAYRHPGLVYRFDDMVLNEPGDLTPIYFADSEGRSIWGYDVYGLGTVTREWAEDPLNSPKVRELQDLAQEHIMTLVEDTDRLRSDQILEEFDELVDVAEFDNEALDLHIPQSAEGQ